MISVPFFMSDSFLACPDCGGLPTFRPGCPQCSSSNIKPDLLVHHYACGHVDYLRTYVIDKERGSLTCPKCHQSELIINCDYDVSHGLQRCLDCGWSGNTKKMIGQCINCETRFLMDEASLMQSQHYRINIKSKEIKT